jgi:hypothetical protein
VTVATYKDLKSLPIPKQAQILLCRLAKLHATSGNTFSSYNYGRQPEDLAHGFPHTEARAITDLLLGAPWRWLENEGLIRQLGNNWHCITEEGYEAVKNPEPAFFAHKEIISALPLLHADFQGYAHYFHENKLKDADSAAFERYENRLNEIRATPAAAQPRPRRVGGWSTSSSRRKSLCVPTRSSAQTQQPSRD